MSQLKLSVMKLICDALDNDVFSADDFIVEFPENGNVLAKIKFLHGGDYYFHITELPKSKGVAATMAVLSGEEKVPATIECPGDYKKIEENKFDSFDVCVRRIRNWCVNIRSDLKTRFPVYKDLEDLKSQFDQHIQEHIKNPDDMITAEEVEKINQKFDALYAEFVTLSDEHKITKMLLAEIKKDFDTIKGNATQYSKGIWAQLAKNKIMSVIKKGVCGFSCWSGLNLTGLDHSHQC